MSIVTTHLNLIDIHRRRDGIPVASSSPVLPGAAAPRQLAPDQYDALGAEARRLRSQAVRELAAMLGRGIARGTRRLARTAASSLLAVGEALAARRTYEELSRLSDHELAEIGLRREDIPAVAWRRSQLAEAQATPAEASKGTVEQEVREAA